MLTGFDVLAHTLYVDKPMRARCFSHRTVNRKFTDKPAGLIVDYIGLPTS